MLALICLVLACVALEGYALITIHDRHVEAACAECRAELALWR